MAIDLGNGLQAEVTIRDAAGLADLNRTELPLVDALLARQPRCRGSSRTLGPDRRLAERRRGKGKGGGNGSAREALRTVPRTARRKSLRSRQQPVIFHAVDQLKAMTEPDLAARLSGRFTVFNPTGLVNPLAAPDDVLLAIPGFTRGDLAAIKAARKTRAAKRGSGSCSRCSSG